MSKPLFRTPKTQHVLPVGGDEPIHFASLDCWCHPNPDKASDGQIVHHNALDCRERFERAGKEHLKDPGQVWVIVGSDV